ncbi:hypothetical protein CIPAW_09G204300 [Carya illinoinensis]|uniref:Legume lectin domain-containing protein n=1 Tax=Carya illinoinensis TaxID=32201 RepID=A0A8T1PFJ2_CARIL|nr:hypothetical protein CIPAW_09G204300 [Carya illinoinensis]
MAALPISRHLVVLTLFIFFLKSLAADEDSHFSFTRFQNDPKKGSKITLYGAAKVVDGGSAIQLTDRVSSSAGRVMYKNPIKLVGGVGSVSEKLSNASAYNLARSGGNIHAWIDYEASSKRLEVRLGQDGSSRPSSPLLSYRIALSKVWEDKEVFVGFSSSTGNSSDACFLHSWSFKIRHVPNWMHSEPLDPKAFAKSTKNLEAEKRRDCLSRVLAAMIFGAACGALAAFTVLYLWTVFGNRRPVVPEEFAMQPIGCEYKKVKVVVDKAIEGGK